MVRGLVSKQSTDPVRSGGPWTGGQCFWATLESDLFWKHTNDVPEHKQQIYDNIQHCKQCWTSQETCLVFDL